MIQNLYIQGILSTLHNKCHVHFIEDKTEAQSSDGSKEGSGFQLR